MDEEASILAETFSTDNASSTMDIYNCQEHLSRSLTRTDQYFKPDQDHISINITLSYTKITHEAVYNTLYDHSTLNLTTVRYTEDAFGIYEFHISTDTEQIDEHAQEDIKNMIGPDLVLSEENAEQLSTDLVQFARIFVGQNPDGNNVFDLDVQVMILHCHALVPRDIWDQVGNDVPCMVPATKESIGRLKQHRVEEGSDLNCVICMEDFQRGSEAVLMPCSHSFHGDCIEEWLNTSHYCPICRFEMPFDEQLVICD